MADDPQASTVVLDPPVSGTRQINQAQLMFELPHTATTTLETPTTDPPPTEPPTDPEPDDDGDDEDES
jgi:hypothetical protein